MQNKTIRQGGVSGGQTKMFPLVRLTRLAGSSAIQQTLGNWSLAAANIVAFASLIVSAPLLKINRPRKNAVGIETLVTAMVRK